MDWFARQVELMQREENRDVEPEYNGDIPLKGTMWDGDEYEITRDPLHGNWNVWRIHNIDEYYETHDRLFRGSLVECKNFVYLHLEVDL